MEESKLRNALDGIIIGGVIAFFVLGIAAAGYMVYKYHQSISPGGFTTNRGKIESFTPNTIHMDPDYAWSVKDVRITNRTTILDIGKQVISVNELSEGDLIFIHGLDNEDYIEGITITILPPDQEDDPAVIQKTDVSD